MRLLPILSCAAAALLLLCGCDAQSGRNPDPPASSMTPGTVTSRSETDQTAEVTSTVQTPKSTKESTKTETTSASAAESAKATDTAATVSTAVTGSAAPTDTAVSVTTLSSATSSGESQETTTEPFTPGTELTWPTTSLTAEQTTVSTGYSAGKDYSLSDAQKALLRNTAFLGDGLLCRMKEKTADLPESACIAAEGVGLHNVFEAIFETDGQFCGVLDLLRSRQPAAVVCVFGTEAAAGCSDAEFIEAYRLLLSKIAEALPNAALYAVSLPPAAAEGAEISGERILRCNAELCEMLAQSGSWQWIDITAELETADRVLKPEYAENGGLSDAAFAPYLWQIAGHLHGNTSSETETGDGERQQGAASLESAGAVNGTEPRTVL